MTNVLLPELERFFEFNRVDPHARETDAYFVTLVRAAVQLYHIPIDELAGQFSVSTPTVQRWYKGKNLPYHSETVSIRNIARDALEKKIGKIQSKR